MRFLILFIICFAFSFAQAQTPAPAPKPKSEWKPVSPTYQLYLDEPVNKILNIEYHDGTPLKYDLGKDKETVYLLNYHKRGGVKVKAETATGKIVEIRRSPCVIDPVIQS
jgi:hypothetical protein